MLVEVKAPQLSESVAEATLGTWHRKAGEYVERDENLVDIETDKVALETPAPESGVLASIIKSDGSTVVSYDVDYFKIDGDKNPTEVGGPAFDDTLYGTSASDHIKSGAGVDHIYAANGGNDFIEAGGGDGRGTLNAKSGAIFSDYVETGAGAVTLLGRNAANDARYQAESKVA